MKQYTQYIYKDNEWRELGVSGGGDGTVTEVTAGAGLNTTSNDASVDGGTITSTGTLYLTKSGVTAGTYQGITVDKYGRVTAASDQGYTTNTGTITKVQANGTDVASSGTANIPAASTSAYGVTELSSATDSTSEALAATPKAVKAAYDLAASKGTGTITGVSVNGTSVATSGVANITSMPASILSGAIPSAVTATTQSAGDNSTKIATTAYVDTAIDNLPDPMVFKGSLGTGGTITALPIDGSASIGDTYKVITAGTYASKAAKVGDTFICLTKTSSANTWELIPSGDEPSGTVTSITIKGSSPITVDSESAITTSGTRTISHANSGVTAGTYKSVTVNATGHVTAGTNPTTLSGYGITDAKIASGVITLGSNTITPLTSSSTLDATKLSGTIPSSCYTDTTYESKTAASGGTDVSLVTTGEKYTWNNKSSLKNLLDGNTYYSLRGEATSEESDSYSMGYAAFAEGYLTKASGYASHAEGYNNISSNYASHAEGFSTEATGSDSHAEGNDTTASGNASHAEGYQTVASEEYTHTEGRGTKANWSCAHAEGYYTCAFDGNAHAEGNCTMAGGDDAHAEGGTASGNDIVGTITAINEGNLSVTVDGLPTFDSYQHHLCSSTTSFSGDKYIATGASGTFTVTKWDSGFTVGGNFYVRLRNKAVGAQSHAEGRHTVAYGNGSHAEGIGTYAKGYAQHVEGKWNVIDNSSLSIVGNGTGPNARSNAYKLDSSGNGVYAGKLTVGTGPSNNMDVATKQYADSVGINSLNIKNGSATGSLRTSGSKSENSEYTIGENAFVEGRYTMATGSAAHAEGFYSKATSAYTHAEGGYTEATSTAAHAEGSNTKASSSYSHAEGYNTTASGSCAHAEGQDTIASGTNAHAEGNYTVAKGGHVEGDRTFALFGGCHAEGTTDNTNISGTITAIDQENLKVIVSGFSSSNNLIYQLYNHNGTTFYGDQYITNAQWSSNQYILTLNKWDSSLAVNGTFYVKFRTMSTDVGAHAEGAGTKAGSRASHAEGVGTIANTTGQHVEGKWNVTNSNYLHIAGNGTADTDRSNAYTLDWSGNGTYAGKVTVGADPTNNMDVATKQYVDNSDTKNTAGSTDTSSKIFLIGATSQAANPQTYSQDTAYVDTDGHLYSNSKQVVNLSDTQALTNKTYNGYTLAAACEKAVTSSIAANNNLPTSNAVKTYVDGMFDSGSNTNGKYFRIGDIQICTGVVDVAKTGSSNFGSGTTYYGAGSWTYPQAFTEIWTVQVTAADTASGLFAGSAGAAPGTSSCSVEWMGSNLSSGSIPLYCFAIGKWK